MIPQRRTRGRTSDQYSKNVRQTPGKHQMSPEAHCTRNRDPKLSVDSGEAQTAPRRPARPDRPEAAFAVVRTSCQDCLNS